MFLSLLVPLYTSSSFTLNLAAAVLISLHFSVSVFVYIQRCVKYGAILFSEPRAGTGQHSYDVHHLSIR